MSGEDLLAEAKKLEKNLLNFFWRQGVSYDEGEDLVQETFLRLWKYRDDYKPTAKLSTFLFLMARQVRLDALRRETRRARGAAFAPRAASSVSVRFPSVRPDPLRVPRRGVAVRRDRAVDFLLASSVRARRR